MEGQRYEIELSCWERRREDREWVCVQGWRELLAVLELAMQQDIKYFPFANYLVVDQVRFCTFILFIIVITENFATPFDCERNNLVKFVVLIILVW